MSDLIAALQIFLKYGNPRWPTHCEHGILRIADIDPEDVCQADKDELNRLGFEWDIDGGEAGFYSYKFGSA